MKMFKLFGFAFASAALLSSCVSDDDTELANYTPTLAGTDFEVGLYDGDALEIQGWQNYAEAGDMPWKSQYYGDNNYAEFTAYEPIAEDRDAVNIGWLISPAVNMDLHTGEVLAFQISQSYVTNPANTFQVLISTDYDGNEANITSATWTPLPANVPGTSATYFEFQDSGDIDLSGYTGTVHIAFKVVGSGTNPNLDGGYQIDNVKITYQN